MLATGNFSPNEMTRLPLAQGNVIRIIVHDDQTRSAELYSSYRRSWQLLTPELCEIVVDIFGARAHGFLIDFKILNK